MGSLSKTVRWIALPTVAVATGVAVWTWRRDLNDTGLAPAEWPPLPPPEPDSASTDTPSPSAAGTDTPDVTVPSSPRPASTASDTSSPDASSFVNALVDAPEARSADRDVGRWTDPFDDGSCPVSHPVKANDNSGIFHVPGGRFYDRTNPQRCYADADAAAADGYRRAKN